MTPRQSGDPISDEQAVSPIIGVILMVAITVVIAGLVYVLVNNISRPDVTPPAPVILARADGSLLVASSPSGLDWFDDMVRGGSCPTPLLNGAAWPTTGGTPMRNGDRITGCNAGESFTLAHRATDTLVYQHTF